MKLLKLPLMKNRLLQNCLPIILTMFFTVDIGVVRAQSLDSLKILLNHYKGTQLCGVYHQIAYELIDVDSDAALTYAQKSLLCAIGMADTLQIVKAAQLKAIAFRRLDEFDSSNKVILSVLPIARIKLYRHELKQLLHGLAIAYLYKAEFDESLRYSFESLTLRREYGSLEEIGYTLSNIGFVYYKLADYSRALDYNSQALDAFTTAKVDKTYIHKLLFNMALCYAYSGMPDRANKYIEDVLSSCNLDCSDEVVQNAAFCRGVMAIHRNDSASAKRYFEVSYLKSVDLGDERLELDNIVYLVQLYLGAGDIVRAEQYLRLAEILIRKGIPYTMEQMKVYNEFAALFERKGNYKKVADFLRRHMALKDSIYADEVTTRLMRIEAAHIEQEKNAKIETQNRMLDLNAKIISRQRIASFLAFTTIILLMGVVILSVRSIREKRRRNTDLEGRVKNRTIELESIAHQSHQFLAENKVWIDKIVSSVRHTTNTVNGLSSLVAKDPESSEKCIRLIEYEMSQLVAHVTGYASKCDDRGRDSAV